MQNSLIFGKKLRDGLDPFCLEELHLEMFRFNGFAIDFDLLNAHSSCRIFNPVIQIGQRFQKP